MINLFKNKLFQRMDLGECSRIHDLALRADYEQAAKNKDYFYDIDVSIMSELICTAYLL